MKRYLLLLFVVALFLSGCAMTRENALLMYDREAEGGFLDNGKIDRYNFFVYGGPGSRPVAYLALDKRYDLETKFWDPTAMTPSWWREIYRSMTLMEEDNYQVRAIVAQDQTTIGYILTRYYQVFAWKVEPGGSTVIVPPPALSPTQPEYFRWRYDND